MDIDLKQRLLIAIVILAVVVIFVPMLFRKHEMAIGPKIKNIPNPPQLNVKTTAKINNDENVAEGLLSKPKPITPKATPKFLKPIVKKTTNTQTIKHKILTHQPLKLHVTPEGYAHVEHTLHVRKETPSSNNVRPMPITRKMRKLTSSAKSNQKAYVVQMGHFREKANAKRLVGRLIDQAFPAFLYSRKTKGKTAYRVLVGPMLTRSEAKDMKAQIQTELSMKSFVTTYKAN